jgi:protein TonB
MIYDKLDNAYKYLLPWLSLLIFVCCSAQSRKESSIQPYSAKSDKVPKDSSSEFVKVETQPILIREVKPDYPKFALEKGIFGEVWVKILIDKTGAVREALIARDSGSKEGFEESALEAAKKTVWKPAMSADGKPLAVWVTYKVSFGFR